MFLLGLAVIAYGVVMTIEADFGVSPWDVLHIGLQKTFGLTIGIWSQLIGVLIILLSYLLGKIKPGIGTILNMVAFGLFIDLFMWMGAVPHVSGLPARILLFLGGLVIMAVGIGMYISPRLGAGPRDSFMLALHERMGWSIQAVRMAIEITVLGMGALLGGPVSIGTLVIAVFTGPLIQRTIPFWERVMAKSYGQRPKEQIHA
ncbi:YitT family protein [Brevibacillus sp. SYP-B805]|uniref:YczE/YyaS/YitT family protein n=1 Tax=Brevibacillus sp. SYP-B805 TaxID=1578199 RepID=UPI0013EA05E6|nr:YitT family protein [Brevibacillus sp. SYP-B805]NGQ94782.1 YitT family protein [Brevibacillus sp. SYP-B805]